MRLIERINQTKIAKKEIALFYLGQAGFYLKTEGINKRIVIDAYLSDAAERLHNFKRMIPSVIEPEEIDADLYLSTHSHVDHLDPDVLDVVAKNPKTYFIGARDCEDFYRNSGITSNRYSTLTTNESWSGKGITIKAVFADHGTLAPDAVGFMIDIEGIRIYHAGDTGYSPEEITASLDADVDIMIVPVNGQFGNLNASEACALASRIKPKFVIASHFWMFLQHVSEGGAGDPITFLKEAEGLPGDIKAIVMAPGESFKYPQEV
jgi:L-ascorbate 6-phosphate lactonase